MDWVNSYRDFSKVAVNDLEKAFAKLRLRCPSTWNSKLEASAQDFHRKTLKLREGNAEKYIDPEIHTTYESKEPNGAKGLIISPNLWNMYSEDAGRELQLVIHHFTIYAPFEGRPFIRAWLEALVPCFSR